MRCIICDGETELCLDLNKQPLANELLVNVDDQYDQYPLGLEYCKNCGHGQLSYFVDPGKLFKNYLYASGTSNTLGIYFSDFASALVKKHGNTISILEIASNDGSFLSKLIGSGVHKCIGIDPAENLVKIANDAGIETVCDFFPSTKIVDKYDVVIAMNVCAHNPDPISFLTGIREVLKEGGIAYIQTSQALMLNSGQFDTIYHEHYSFFTVSSMREACNRVGLSLSNYELTNIHGVSSIFHISKSIQVSPDLFNHGISKDLAILKDVKIENPDDVYREFNHLAMKIISDTTAILSKYKAIGYKIALAGVAAKALTFYHAANLECDLFIDEATLKVGRYVPGIEVPIGKFDSLDPNSKYLVIIGAWNFFEEIREKLKRANPTTNMLFLQYFPEVRLIA
jgi:hypothetical protein